MEFVIILFHFSEQYLMYIENLQGVNTFENNQILLINSPNK